MPGTDWSSTGVVLALLSIAVPSAITVLGLVLHAVFLEGRTRGQIGALKATVEHQNGTDQDLYSKLGDKVNKEDCLHDREQIGEQVDNLHSKANANRSDISRLKGRMNSVG